MREKPKPPVVRTEKVVCACGHEATFELFADKVDRFREGRRKKLTGRACPACRQKLHQERIARAMATSAERKQALPTGRAGVGDDHGRLPDGAAFALTYNATAVLWSGTLSIPATETAAEQTFRAESSGVFSVLRKLDSLYRKSAEDSANAG